MALGTIAAASAAPAATRPRILPRLEITTRDGVTLATDVFLPEANEPRPTVVLRTPYGRSRPFLLLLAHKLSEAGICAVLQDCRGRYQSGGTFDLKREEGDTYDTLEWLAGQEWTTGDVGLMGISIATYSNFLTAARALPRGVRVKTLVSVMGVVDCHRVFFRNGALVLHWALPWVTLISDRHMGRTLWANGQWERLVRHLPLATAVDSTRGNGTIWRELVSRPAAGGIWESLSAVEQMTDLDVPCLHLGGWYDFLLSQTLLGYRSMTEQGAQQRLVVGAWNHLTVFSAFGPEKGDGAGADGTHLDLMEMVLSWYRKWLGLGTDESSDEGVLLFLLEERAWIRTDRYPPAETVVQDWYLTSGGRANTARGDGRLVARAPEEAGYDTFTYDPQDPVPTSGGAVWPFRSLGLEPGPADRSVVEDRSDVLVYTSEPLAEDLFVVGQLTVVLWAATSARDTDFTAELVDVDPLGVARLVQDGLIRGRFRESLARESLLELHRPYRFALDLEATAYKFRAGHRLRLAISSSNFPKFDRNLNTAADAFTGRSSLVARQTVFHGGETASRLRLPILPREAFEALRWQRPKGAHASYPDG